jgi:hypothetical protein
MVNGWSRFSGFRVRRTACDERGATQANARRGLCRPVALPGSLPSGDVVVHDVLADAATGYAQEQLLAGGREQARAVGLWLEFHDGTLTVDRLSRQVLAPVVGFRGVALVGRTAAVRCEKSGLTHAADCGG